MNIDERRRQVRRLYPNHSAHQIAKMFGVTIGKIHKDVEVMQLSKSHAWKVKDDKWLVENYHLYTVEELADYIGVSTSSIYKRVSDLRKQGKIIKTRRTYRLDSWTPSEDSWLINNSMKLTASQCAEHVGRSVNAVNNRIIHLRKTGRLLIERRNSAKERRKAVRELLKKRLTTREIADKLGTYSQVIYNDIKFIKGNRK